MIHGELKDAANVCYTRKSFLTFLSKTSIVCYHSFLKMLHFLKFEQRPFTEKYPNRLENFLAKVKTHVVDLVLTFTVKNVI